MLSTGAIQQVYQNCLDRATMWLRRNDYPVTEGVAVKIRKNGAGDVEIEPAKILHFQGWPYRDGSREMKIDILARVMETVSPEGEACTKANLWVNYFRINGNIATAMESLHYEYKVAPETKHPISHVENSNKVLEKRPESFNYETVEDEALRKRCKNVRIPSAFVNLPGLFAILAADHMSKTDWREFMGYCLVHFKKVPAVPENAFIYKAIRRERLCAWAWYEM